MSGCFSHRITLEGERPSVTAREKRLVFRANPIFLVFSRAKRPLDFHDKQFRFLNQRALFAFHYEKNNGMFAGFS